MRCHTTIAADAGYASLGDDLYSFDHFEAVFQEDIQVEPFDVYSVPPEELPVDFPAFLQQRHDAARSAPTVVMDVRVEHGRPRCHALRFEPTTRPITASDVHELALERKLEEAMAQVTFAYDGRTIRFAPAGSSIDLPMLQEMNRRLSEARVRSRSLSDEHLERVAEVYREAISNGDPPKKTVAKQLADGKTSTAGRWIAKARDAGFLGPTTPGKKGI